MDVRRVVPAVALAVLCLSPVAQMAPQASQEMQATVDEIVAKHLDAMGGLQKLKSIETIKKVAKVTMNGRETKTTMYFKRPNLSRQEVTIDGKNVVNAFDGRTAWIINPLTGFNRPVTISGAQLATIREDSAFDAPLVDYQSRGTLVDYVGKEPLGEGHAHHLRVTTATRQVRHLYLDATTYLEVKLTADVDRNKLEQLSMDYREVFGLKVAHHLKTLVNGVVQAETHVESVLFNLPLDDKLFQMPKG